MLGAYLEGWRRALAAPSLAIAVLGVTVAVSLPVGAMMHRSIEAQLGQSLAADDTLGGWNTEWAREFAAANPGIGSTLTHEILGFGGTLSSLSRLVEGRAIPAPLVGVVAAYLVVWLFLSGGVIDRLARARGLGAATFLSTCARYFFRMARLGAIAAVGYAALFLWVLPLLSGPVRALVTRQRPSDGILQALVVLTFVLLLGLLTLVIDLARVRLVVEDRRSVVAALLAGGRFARRRAGRLAGLFVLNVFGQAVLARIWLQSAPSAETAGWLALLSAEVYLAARIWARLAFIASEVVFFQGELAHATYTAPPPAVWPDSASVEAIRNLGAHGRQEPSAGLE
jgi:hypothetical protein